MYVFVIWNIIFFICIFFPVFLLYVPLSSLCMVSKCAKCPIVRPCYTTCTNAFIDCTYRKLQIIIRYRGNEICDWLRETTYVYTAPWWSREYEELLRGRVAYLSRVIPIPIPVYLLLLGGWRGKLTRFYWVADILRQIFPVGVLDLFIIVIHRVMFWWETYVIVTLRISCRVFLREQKTLSNVIPTDRAIRSETPTVNRQRSTLKKRK